MNGGNTIGWMWEWSDGTKVIQAMFAATSIRWDEGAGETFQQGFPMNRRDLTVGFLREQAAELEGRGAQMTVRPRTFDLRLDAIDEVSLGVTQGLRPTPRLITQLRRALESPPRSLVVGGTLTVDGKVIRGESLGDLYIDTVSGVSATWTHLGWVSDASFT